MNWKETPLKKGAAAPFRAYEQRITDPSIVATVFGPLDAASGLVPEDAWFESRVCDQLWVPSDFDNPGHPLTFPPFCALTSRERADDFVFSVVLVNDP